MEIVVASAVRTPIGKFQGEFARISAPELGAITIKEAIKRANIGPEQVDEVLMGNVLTAGVGQNPARQAAIYAGLPDSVPTTTIGKVCGSGMKSMVFAAQAIKAGDYEIIVAGGQENMTMAPYYLPKARSGFRLGDGKVIDGMVYDGLFNIYSKEHMGITGEIIAERYNVTREEADQLSAESHQKAAQAQKDGKFKDEMVPVEVKTRKDSFMLENDTGVRPQTTVDSLSKLRPVFKKDGVVTAGNSSQISDGASALVIMSKKKAEELGIDPLASIRAYDTFGGKPELLMEAPIHGTKRLLEREGLKIGDIDIFEHNEAFATASVAVKKTLEVPSDIFNINGGAVALGHPIGCSGARVSTTLMYLMKNRDAHRGLATLCIGGGHAITMIFER